jgi:DNA polymerase (family X)
MKNSKSLNNRQISQLLRQMAAAYKLKKNNRFRVSAYENAADAIEHSSQEAKDLWESNQLTDLPGVGKSIANHLNELFKTGEVKHFKEIKKDFPSSIFEFIQIPGLGPKTAYKLANKLKIKSDKNAIKKLKIAAENKKIRAIGGFGEKSEKEILENIKQYLRKKPQQRMLLPKAEHLARQMSNYISKNKDVIKIKTLGSLRRKAATIGDIDLAVSTKKPKKIIDWFLKYSKKIKTIESGKTKASILITGNHQVDLRVVKPKSYGSLLQHFTGSKQHNIKLREFALEKGYSLSEYGIKISKISDKTNKIKSFSNEKRFYNFLGLNWIPPELREDMGEIQAAAKSNLPNLVSYKDIKGDLHIHSNINIEESHDSGLDSMDSLISQAKALNYKYIAFSEHNPSTTNHTENDIYYLIKKKKNIIDKINYSREKNRKQTENNVFIFNSLETDIKPNGDLAISSKILNLLDFAIVSIHSGFKQNKAKMTKRVLKALRHPKAKILGHPTGRLLMEREGYELDWEKIFEFCAKKNKYLEINAYPTRLDLTDSLIFKAIKAKVKLVINTDAHQVKHMENIKYGVAMARRGWAEKGDIINCNSLKNIKNLLK